MKVTILYIRVIKKHDPNFPEHKNYEESSKRFLASYQHFKPKIAHELVVVNCGSESHDGMFDCVASRYEADFSGGFDCGTYRTIGARQDCDIVIGLNTHTYFWRQNWLEPFVKCAQRCGPGVYGATASHEQHPHLRTPCIAFAPSVIAKYPHPVTNREEAAWFEAGPNNFSLWADREGYPACLVTENASYDVFSWRKPKNGFRDGNQNNCLVWDRHTEIYAKADSVTKKQLELRAAGR